MSIDLFSFLNFFLVVQCTLPVLILQLYSLTEIKVDYMISCSVIQFTSPLPYLERYVNLSAAPGIYMKFFQNSSMFVETLGVAGFES